MLGAASSWGQASQSASTRHQLMTYLTKQGIITPKLQLLSGHAVEQSLAVYRALALSDVADEYEAAMQHFPV
jgi:hypothetical protein